MQKLLSLLQSAKSVSIENVDFEISCLKKALKLIDTSILSVNLEYCIENLNSIEIYMTRNQYDMIPESLDAYNRLLDECIELVNAQIHPIVKDIPSDLIFKLLKTSVDHINRLEVGYAGFDKITLNEMFSKSVKKIIKEISEKSQEMAEFIAEDYTAKQKAEKWGKD